MARINGSQVWKQVKLSNDDHQVALKTSVQNNFYEFKMTDYMRLWSETISLRDTSMRFETQNPGMEIEEEELPKVIDEALSNPASEFNLEISDDKSSVKLLMSFETYGMKMNWLFDCALESPEKIYHHLFGPLLSSLSYLLHERESLLKMVVEKDAALEKLAKVEGRANKRKYVAFDQKSFEESILKDFDDKADDTKHKRFFEASYQDILGHFEKNFERLSATAVPDDSSERRVSRAAQINVKAEKQSPTNVVVSPTKSEKESEEERRMELEKKLAEKKANKKKKVLKF